MRDAISQSAPPLTMARINDSARSAPCIVCCINRRNVACPDRPRSRTEVRNHAVDVLVTVIFTESRCLSTMFRMPPHPSLEQHAVALQCGDDPPCLGADLMWPAKRHLDIFGGLQHPFHPSPVAAGLAAYSGHVRVRTPGCPTRRCRRRPGQDATETDRRHTQQCLCGGLRVLQGDDQRGGIVATASEFAGVVGRP